MNVIMSVYPKFAIAILSGEKTIELRSMSMREWRKGDLVFIYATAPISKVIGYAIAADRINLAKWKLLDRPELLSEIGVTAAEVDNYLHGRDTAHLYRLSDPKPFNCHIDIGRGPQTYRYVDDAETENLILAGV